MNFLPTVQYDDGKANAVTLESDNDYVHVRLPNGDVICITGDGVVDLNGVPQYKLESK